MGFYILVAQLRKYVHTVSGAQGTSNRKVGSWRSIDGRGISGREILSDPTNLWLGDIKKILTTA